MLDVDGFLFNEILFAVAIFFIFLRGRDLGLKW